MLAAALAKSSPLPGDFGVLEDPKEANAPEPRPKADEAPALGGPAPDGVNGPRALNGLFFPCDEVSPPNRRGALYVRE